jgi:hypothetical protein
MKDSITTTNNRNLYKTNNLPYSNYTKNSAKPSASASYPFSIRSLDSLKRIFAPLRKPNTYLFKREELMVMPSNGNISIPLNIDTEYKAFPVHWSRGNPTGRLGITTQVCGVALAPEQEGIILAHPSFAGKLPLYPVANSGFHPVDYLAQIGYQASIKRVENRCDLKGLPIAEFVLYAHFALVEAMLIVEDDFKKDFRDLMLEKSQKKSRFEMTRRLRSVSPCRERDNDFIDMHWILSLEGVDYAVRVCFIDTGALHGQASYKDICEAAGVKLDAKDNFTSAEKGKYGHYGN